MQCAAVPFYNSKDWCHYFGKKSLLLAMATWAPIKTFLYTQDFPPEKVLLNGKDRKQTTWNLITNENYFFKTESELAIYVILEKGVYK